ncbi:MAG: hypothetical protein LBK25_00065 [Treponema sp.]|nr:hypothetical protein [Treponema sp.]
MSDTGFVTNACRECQTPTYKQRPSGVRHRLTNNACRVSDTGSYNARRGSDTGSYNACRECQTPTRK